MVHAIGLKKTKTSGRRGNAAQKVVGLFVFFYRCIVSGVFDFQISNGKGAQDPGDMGRGVGGFRYYVWDFWLVLLALPGVQ